MEHNLKKKTKHLIALRTNNFIQTQIQKQTFFNQVLHALQTNLQPKQFQFLTTYLLFQQNNSHKKIKHQIKNPTQKRIMTLPQQRPFNICEIDPNIFQQNPTKRDQFLLNKTSIATKQYDFNCTNTPKRKVKKIIFQNKRIMDLDKKLHAKYQASKNLIVYNPNILSLEKQNKKNQRFFIKTAYQNSLKRSKAKVQMRRLKTSFEHSRQNIKKGYDLINKPNQRSSDFSCYIRDKSLRNGQMAQITGSQRLRQSQNSIPKYFMEQVLLSRRYNKFDQTANDFSDLKLSSRYKDCFS